MDLRIDPDSTIPIYQQIVDSIKHLVATARLKPGEQLPTVRELATTLRINPNTVARAYTLLDGDSVITTQQGRGTYVREHPDNVHLTRVRQEQLKSLMDGVIGKALSMGYTVDEIQDAFDTQKTRWTRLKKT
jgi:GntR family transcriptional regulator